jgi:hypothetical protein
MLVWTTSSNRWRFCLSRKPDAFVAARIRAQLFRGGGVVGSDGLGEELVEARPFDLEAVALLARCCGG